MNLPLNITTVISLVGEDLITRGWATFLTMFVQKQANIFGVLIKSTFK